MEKCLFIIKPEAVQYRVAIREKLLRGGLSVFETRVVVLDKKFLAEVYCEIGAKLFESILKYMQCGNCEIGLITGDDVLGRLVKIVGSHFDPSRCEAGSIRATFGLKEPRESGEALYFQNAFHRPQNNIELSRDYVAYLNFVERLKIK